MGCRGILRPCPWYTDLGCVGACVRDWGSDGRGGGLVFLTFLCLDLGSYFWIRRSAPSGKEDS